MARGAAETKTPPAPRNERLEARVPAEQKELFLQAAELQGRSLTDFVLANAHEAAARTIEASSRFI